MSLTERAGRSQELIDQRNVWDKTESTGNCQEQSVRPS